MKYFHRQIQLWGQEAQNNLSKKSIAIIGCGGLGSSLGITLGSSGIGEIHLVDFDTVGIHNIHRQIAFRLGDEGKNKADVLSDLIKSRYEDVKIIKHICTFDEFAKKDLYVDLILDGTDNLPTRAKIDEFAKKKNIPWIYGSVEAFNFQICFFDKSSFNTFEITNRTPSGIAGPIVMQAASFQGNLALKYLLGQKVKKDILYYSFYTDTGEFDLKKLKMP